MTWEEWIRHHLGVFGMRSEGEVEMVTLWAQVFEGSGFNAAELARATTWVAAHDPPEYRRDALQRLAARVRQEREETRQREEIAPPDEERGCSMCFGTGWAVVPCPQAFHRGEYREDLAVCSCGLGRWRKNHGDPRPDVELWFHHWPGWRDFMDAKRRARLAEVEADNRAGVLDQLLGKIMARFRGDT